VLDFIDVVLSHQTSRNRFSELFCALRQPRQEDAADVRGVLPLDHCILSNIGLHGPALRTAGASYDELREIFVTD
jgi:hypothetical protein